MTWLDHLKGNPLGWLLEEDNPSVRYRTLRDLLDRPANDPELLAAHAQIGSFPPVAGLLAAQRRDGYWVKRDYYLPKYNGTFWTLTILADLGLTAQQEQIARACQFMFGFQREHGAFCRRRRVSGQGIVWDDQPGPCTHARIVRFLIQFGYRDDPRVRAAVNWIVESQRPDGMWHCGKADRPGCLRATLDVLHVAALDPELAAQEATVRAADVIAAGTPGRPPLLMARGMARYHVKLPWKTLQYPAFGYSVIATLDSLARLGYTLEYPAIAAAADFLLNRQLPDGRWPLDHAPHTSPFEMGEVRQPHKWLTLDALRVIKLLYA